MYVSCTGYQTDLLQNNHLKNYHPLHIPMSIPNSIDIHLKSIEKTPDMTRWYVILLSGQTNYPFLSLLPLTILFNTTIQVCDSILVQPIPVNSEEHVIGVCGEISGEISFDC